MKTIYIIIAHKGAVMVEDFIERQLTVNAIAKELQIGFYKAKQLVEQHLGSKERLNEYQSIARSKAVSSSAKTRRRRKTPKSDLVIKALMKKGVELDDVKIKYVNDILSDPNCAIDSVPRIVKFLVGQFKYYGPKDDFYTGWQNWAESGFGWTFAKLEHWVWRYGEVEGTQRFLTRLDQCNHISKLDGEAKKAWSKKRSKISKHIHSSRGPQYSRANSKMCVEYWLKRGYCEDEAKSLISQYQSHNNARLREVAKENGTYKELFVKCKEFWMSRGHSPEEASQIISKSQRTFSRDICIKKYGEEVGYQIWQRRQEVWQETLNKKSDDEKIEISRKKFTGSVQGRASKSSLKFFNKLLAEIRREELVSIDDVYLGIPGKGEYWLRRDDIVGLFFYDFCIPKLKYIVEFHGKNFHYDESIGAMQSNLYKLDEYAVYEKDKKKKQLAVSCGFEYDVIKEGSDYESEVQRVMGRIRSLCGARKSSVGTGNRS